MKKLVNILLMFYAIEGVSQTYFNNAYSIPLYQGLTSVIEDNGYFSIGQEITSTYRSMFFVKTDLNGDTIWTKNYPRNQFAYYTGFSSSLIKTVDNKYAFAGTMVDMMDTIDEGNTLLVKITIQGDTLWTKEYGGTELDQGNILIQCSDSGFVIAGATKSFGGGQSDFYMIKTDSLGQFQWQKTFGNVGQEEAYSIIKTSDGGFLLSGHQNNQFYVVKADFSGNLQWQQNYPGTSGWCYAAQLPDSSYILSGAKVVSGFGGQAHLMHVDKLGGVIWQNHYGNPSVNDWFTTSTIILSDGSIIVGGQQMSGSIPIGMLVKTDNSGNQQWLRTYYFNPLIDNYVYDVKPTLDNGFILSGQAYNTLTDGWLVKVDSNGCEIPNCNVGINEFDEEITLQVYPNPGKDEVNIEIGPGQLKDYEISISNILGQEISTTICVNRKLNISEFHSGIYFITAINKQTKQIVTVKFIKE